MSPNDMALVLIIGMFTLVTGAVLIFRGLLGTALERLDLAERLLLRAKDASGELGR